MTFWSWWREQPLWTRALDVASWVFIPSFFVATLLTWVVK